MRANELMIGDWVISLKEDHLNEFAQVIDISHHDTVLLEYHRTNYYTDIEHIKPIPITSEILEKNGMKPFNIDNLTDKASAKWWHKSGYFFIKQYHFKHNGFKPTYSFGCNSHTLIEGIEYVHELQHAMKLCRINNEIVL